jgi:hypothetical protein
MAFDSWGVMPGLEENEFVLAFRDLSPDRGKPFMKTCDPMSEDQIREELKKIGVTEAQADIALLKAKAEWKKSCSRVPDTYQSYSASLKISKLLSISTD